ncbi:hypothetical protein TSAR_012449 [Trichomalopsis sarcophagae]|uniref:Uncharacterized protein n=1 Tax=Trichomalopsis sarcophagae TaxID=543379 RepID=A0A232F784_9HYME|nr:hypothetical protein TSAR_012449 [Trichomalopsis sarcophagae]
MSLDVFGRKLEGSQVSRGPPGNGFNFTPDVHRGINNGGLYFLLSGTLGVPILTRLRRSQRWLPGTDRKSITRGNSANAAQQKPGVAVISAEPSCLLLVTAPGGFA